ncbi:hypothetical protein [Cognatishimia sp. SS12]|uniref:hypothetical protein n=1 Tax=Cognatishimia sp. SS12 TaxID=2979465 RepID=UPI0023314860|nr:hypothetical protein [Cognatishimia sp. SS12]
MLLTVTFYAFFLSKMPSFVSSLNYVRKLPISLVIFILIVCISLLVIQTRSLSWFTDPRHAYQHQRNGNGLIYALFVFSIALSFLKITQSKFKRTAKGSLVLLLVLFFVYISGSKGIFLSFVIVLFLNRLSLEEMTINQRVLYTVLGIVCLFCTIIAMIFLGFFGENFVSVFTHFDAIFNSVKFYENQGVGLLNNNFHESSLLNSRIFSKLQLALFSAQSFHQIYYPIQAELGHFRAHLGSTYFIATNLPVISLLVVGPLINISLLIKLSLTFFACKNWNSVHQDYKRLVIVFLVFQPTLKFFVDLQIVYTLIFVVLISLGFSKSKKSTIHQIL